MLDREVELWAAGKIVAGLDEVGRGPLAGPVIACAVILAPDTDPIEGLTDSKQLTRIQRERLSTEITKTAACWALAGASVNEIDRLNIRKATALAMRRCLERLPLNPDHVLVDGNPLPELGRPHEAIVKGDSISLSIAAASVLAKVLRDHLMTLLDMRYPGFAWASNKGYGTDEHWDAINELGPTAHHRKTFAQLLQLNLF